MKKSPHLVKGSQAAKEHMQHLRSLRSSIPGLNQGHQRITFDHTPAARPPKRKKP
jgi:hypothetical protein